MTALILDDDHVARAALTYLAEPDDVRRPDPGARRRANAERHQGGHRLGPVA